MASTRDFLEFVLEQLSDIPGIDYRAMMGEFIIYYRERVIGGIYDNRFLIKSTATARKMIPNAQMEIPYPGGSPMIMIPDIENREFLSELFPAIYPELPDKKKK